MEQTTCCGIELAWHTKLSSDGCRRALVLKRCDLSLSAAHLQGLIASCTSTHSHAQARTHTHMHKHARPHIHPLSLALCVLFCPLCVVVAVQAFAVSDNSHLPSARELYLCCFLLDSKAEMQTLERRLKRVFGHLPDSLVAEMKSVEQEQRQLTSSPAYANASSLPTQLVLPSCTWAT